MNWHAQLSSPSHVAIYIKINLVPDDRGVKRLKVGLSRCPHALHCLLTKICHELNPRTTSPIVPSSPPAIYMLCFSQPLLVKGKERDLFKWNATKNIQLLVVCIWNFPCSCSYLAHLPISSWLLSFIIIINIITTSININMHEIHLQVWKDIFAHKDTYCSKKVRFIYVHVWDRDRDRDSICNSWDV